MPYYQGRKALFAWAPILMAACSTALPQEDVSRNRNVQKLQLASESMRLQLNASLEKEGIEFRVPGMTPLPVRSLPQPADNEKGIVLGGTQSGVEFRFCAATKRINAFFHWEALERAFGKGAALFDGPTEAQWSKDKAARVGRATIAALMGAFPDNVVLEQVEYVHPIRESPQYYIGAWQLTYARVDTAGNRFENDCITLQILERYGPYSVGINFKSTYSEPLRDPIPKEDAIAASQVFANRIARSKMARDWYGPFTLTGNTTARLLVVNPNGLLEAEHVAHIRAEESRIARLAWQVSHEIALNRRRSARGRGSPKAHLLIWIDAATRECLGGDLH